MPSNLEYALLSANSYAQSELDVSPLNTIPLPSSSWGIVGQEDDPTTGFTARAYRNPAGEVVIAFAGTSIEGNLLQLSRDWVLGNLAGSGAMLPLQVVKAARFYLDLVNNDSSIDPAKISFTGHSLGGGLASLMAVYFDRPAVTFDTAPFEKSADSAIVLNGLKVALLAGGYALPSEFASYVALDYLFGAVIPSPTRVAREGNVHSVYIKDEVLSLLQTPLGRVVLPAIFGWNPALFAMALNVAPIAGTEQVIDAAAVSGNDWGFSLLNGHPLDLHSINLLSGLLQSPQLLAASQGNPEVLQAIFTSRLHRENPQSNDTEFNLLNLMVQRHQAGEGAWDAFARDVGKLVGSLSAPGVKFGLTQLDLAMHYAEARDRARSLASGPMQAQFAALDGGIQFTLNPDHAPFTADGTDKLHEALAQAFPDLARHFRPAERYSLQSEGAMTVTATADAKADFALGGAEGDTIATGDGNDLLFGLDGADTLDAGAGNDTLVGGPGDDILIGGAGLDFYFRRAADGNDQIIEVREGGILGGRIFLVSNEKDKPLAGLFLQQGGADLWVAAEGGMTLERAGNWTLTLNDGSALDLGTDIRSGDFGLYLSNAPQAQATDRTILGDLAPVDFGPDTPGTQTQVDDLGNVITDPAQPEPGRADTLFDSAGNDDIQGFAGADVIEAFRGGDDRLDGGAGRDIVSGRAGDDVVIGGSEGDLLRGDAGRDKLYAESEVTVEVALAALEATGTGVRGDFMDGGADDDVLVGGAANDALNGGSGADLILGGGGDDDVDGDLETSIVALDWSVTREIVEQPGEPTLYNRVYNSVGFLSTSPGGDDVVYGGAGADWLFTREGNDWIDAGSGDDVVFGEHGADEIFGGAGADRLFGDSASVPLAQHGDDYLDGGDGNDLMNGDGGNDILFGGEGDDEMFGDSTLIGGTDYLDGEGGNDLILGAGNDDTIFGGDGDDFLQGDSGTGLGDGDDFIDGEAGVDTILGEGGDDELHGGDGDDLIAGNAGADVISGGAGNDTLVGDDGDPLAGDADTIDGGDGDDVVLGDGGDDILAGGAGFDQLQGGAGDDTMDGGDDDDVLFGEAGNDTLAGGAGNDQLIGGLGDDVLAGGDGDDVYFYAFGDGADRISDSGGTDFLVFNNFLLGDLRLGVGSLKIVVPGGEVHLDGFDPDNPLTGPIEFFQFADGAVLTHAQLVQALGFSVQGTPGDDALSGTALGDSIQALGGNDSVFGRAGDDTLDLGAGDDFADGGDGNDTLLGGAGNDVLGGGAGVDQLSGGAGDDYLGGGPGNDLPLQGGAGNDTYLFGAGDGQDVAIDTEGVNGVQLLGGLTADQVTLQRAGNDLVILVNGTSERFTARDWFANPAAWGQLGLGDGTVLDRDGVQARLVQNQPPLLNPDSAATFEDNPVAVTGNALANDVDPEGRALSVTNPGAQAGTYGTLTLQSSGAFSYAVANSSGVVQSLAQGQTVSDSFDYTATDSDPNGAASASSTITVSVEGRNDAPVAMADFGFLAEDDALQASGNVLANDSDVDNGAVLRVVSPGTLEGTYGTLVLGATGSFTYTLRNDSSAVQSLGQFVEVSDVFAYAASDGIAQSGAALEAFIEGRNDAPVVAIPLEDQTAVAGRSFTYAIAADSFTDIDAGDVLSYSASLVDGFDLPDWLSFDDSSQTFSGTTPSDATGFIDVEVTAGDGHGEGEEVPEATASDVFRITFEARNGGGGGGGQGNEGVGNGEDPPPPGHDDNFNDGPGTGPGNPGANGGNGLGHSMRAMRTVQDVPQLRQVRAAAAMRSIADPHPGNGKKPQASEQTVLAGGDAALLTAEAPAFQELGAPTGNGDASQPANANGNGDTTSPDPLAAWLAQAPQYDFALLLDWLAESPAGETLDPEEIRRRWARVANARYSAPDDLNVDAPLGWNGSKGLAIAQGMTAMAPLNGLGVASGFPELETFKGLSEGFAKL
jgi:VCBS repeat-containing protein